MASLSTKQIEGIFSFFWGGGGGGWGGGEGGIEMGQNVSSAGSCCVLAF